MIRLLVLAALMILTILEVLNILKGSLKKKIFIGAYIFLTLFLIMRFGQGSDYFSYNSLYGHVLGREPLFELPMFLFYTLKLPYAFFVGAVGIVSMVLLYMFQKRF
ncbi:MAG: hypothetical protein LBI03_04890, partial [Clostridiales bacterium]|nr:hypothetical protein [Clostridiales bacterium]